jgi:predicted RNA-binding protein YlqC (UPF0109 family)
MNEISMADIPQDSEFVEYIVKALVDHPEDVQVERSIDEMGVLITLSVNPTDMGMVIGREGANAKALRTLLRVIGARNNARVNLKINEPEGGQRDRSARHSSSETNASGEQHKRSLDDVVNDINV